MASAQERPAVRPTHDVTVDYQLQAVDAHGSASVRIIRLSWTGNGNRLRLDMQGGTGFVLVDYAAHRMELVITQQKAFVASALRSFRRTRTIDPPGRGHACIGQ